jgi:hypothetical protein
MEQILCRHVVRRAAHHHRNLTEGVSRGVSDVGAVDLQVIERRGTAVSADCDGPGAEATQAVEGSVNLPLLENFPSAP